MFLALVGVEWWVWGFIARWFSRTAWEANGYRMLSPAGIGILISILAVTVIIAAAVLLFTEVDSRGIHRPDWAGGAFIPWSSVTEVSVGRSPEFLEVRAGSKKVNLNLMLFTHPPSVVALIRRQVPPERLKHI